MEDAVDYDDVDVIRARFTTMMERCEAFVKARIRFYKSVIESESNRRYAVSLLVEGLKEGKRFSMVCASLLGTLGYETSKNGVPLLVQLASAQAPLSRPAGEALYLFGPVILTEVFRHIDRLEEEADALGIRTLLLDVVLPIALEDRRLTGEETDKIICSDIMPRIVAYGHNSDSAALRKVACELVLRIGLPHGLLARQMLHELLADSSNDVRIASGRALRKLGEGFDSNTNWSPESPRSGQE